MFLNKILTKNCVKQSLNYHKLMSTSKSLLTTDIKNNFDNNNINNGLNQSQSIDDFKPLATDKRIEAKIKLIILEFELIKRRDCDSVPDKLTVNYMKQLLKCWKMKKNRNFWIDLSFKKRLHLLKLFKKLELNDGFNQLVLPVMPFEKEKFYSNRLKNASLFGQNIIFDLSFDKYMSTLECKNCAEQLWRIYHFNRYKRFIKSSQELPFNINIVNVNNNERTNQFLNYLYPELFTPDSYCNITSKSYLDLFPKQQLIYLSPHAQEVMTDYDHSAAFIIGGLVDRQKIICLSNEKAKHENIRSMRLPLDDLVKTHNIQSLDDVIRVLHDLKDATIYKQFIDWEKTLRQNLPKHKLKSEGQVAYEMMKKEFLDLDDCDSYDLDENNLNV